MKTALITSVIYDVLDGESKIQSCKVSFPSCCERAVLESNWFSGNNEAQIEKSIHLILDELKRNGVTEITVKKQDNGQDLMIPIDVFQF